MDNSASPLPRFNKCCFLFGLRSGVLIFVSIEALFWALLTFAAIFSEIKYITNVDIGEFSDVLDNDWYYFLLFGYPRELIDERIRTYLIVGNLVLCLIFIIYFIFTLMLLIGISRRSRCLFLPYLVCDVFFLVIALPFGFIGMFFRFQIAKICIIFFFIKFYFAVCVYSLFKNYTGKHSSENPSIRSSLSQHQQLEHSESSPVRANPGLGEAPLAVAV
ncbi:hypothetical protein PVAND_005701 [Polypedilum vanderplanki]|uniref:Uncharacterized protein n=1 Tax=Polypedilum vanderplanki TaxID=319348 RepID=A0A9J6C1A8_POLVA|nr:hypothetical protein PVAND_005701 [Polypedilum vanderplanki]